MTSFEVTAILALLPKPSSRVMRLLLAISTFRSGEDSWRSIGAALLARTAGLSHNTADAARTDAIKAGLIEYRPGNGKGNHSAYRLHVGAKDPKNAGYLSGAQRYPATARKGTQLGSAKVPSRNPSTSANANAALNPSALQTSAPTPARARAHARLAAADPAVSAAEVDHIAKENAPSSRDVWAVIASWDDDRATLEIGKARADLTPDGAGPRTQACRGKDHSRCGPDAYPWCTCPCHGKGNRKTGDAIGEARAALTPTRQPPSIAELRRQWHAEDDHSMCAPGARCRPVNDHMSPDLDIEPPY